MVLVVGGAGLAAGPADDTVRLEVMVTADEHGWLQPMDHPSGKTLGGAANVLSWWTEFEDYRPETHLLLSAGDNWTGPSISTWFKGEPVVEIFNLMGYDAVALGNHEFDFGREVLARRMAASEYPYLGANIRRAADGGPVDFVEPYVIREVAGVRVGIIGLITTSTPSMVHPDNVGDLAFDEYRETLEHYVPRMREEGAEIVILLGHVCSEELVELARGTGRLVDVMLAGHCHEFGAQEVNGVPIIACGWAWRGYVHLTIDYRRDRAAVESCEHRLVKVEYPTGGANPVTPHVEVASLVKEWRARVDAVLAKTIGYTVTGIELRSWPMANWVTDAWLWANGNADVSLTNWGGLRQSISPGPITVGDIVGLLPFENDIYDAHISGAELAENLACCGGAAGGISYTVDGEQVEVRFLDGRVFHPDSMYHVLVNDFMYAGGDDYLFGEQDPEAYDTGIHWRQPVIDWMRRLETTAEDPLENYLDSTPRQDETGGGGL
jgi:2',3'-cyclic-nucleotide 2'-phosphodiesterase (5'-nucleotidase family)